MTLSPPPKFHGLITIVSNVNDTLDWFESDQVGGAPVTDNPQAVLAAGSYYIGTDTETGSLAKAIKDAMETASNNGAIGLAHGGNGCDYAVSIADTTGIITITVSGSGFTPAWYPKITSVETAQTLTGVALAVGGGEQHDNHLGWLTDAAYPAAATAHTADGKLDNSFYPNQPAEAYDPNKRESHVVESVSLTGDVRAYDFGGTGVYQEIRDISFQYLSETAKDDWLDFWLSYAKQGSPDGRFRFYPDRTSSTYTEMVLTGDSLGDTDCPRFVGYAYYGLSFSMRRYKA